jgi:uncharacterized protein
MRCGRRVYVYTNRYILVVRLEFTWDPVKNKSNVAKHGVEFETARLVFNDPQSVTEQDREVDGEPRWQTIGMIEGTLMLLVAHLAFDSEDTVHIISAKSDTARKEEKCKRQSIRMGW